MEMVGLGELAGADRKGRSMIYTPMTNSQGERIGSVRFRARYYEGIRPYISRPTSTTVRFPSVFPGNSVHPLFHSRPLFTEAKTKNCFRFRASIAVHENCSWNRFFRSEGRIERSTAVCGERLRKGVSQAM